MKLRVSGDTYLLLSPPLPELIGAAMVRVGVHISIAGSVVKSVERAESAGCNTFQIFSRNPRGWAFHDLNGEDCADFKRELSRSGIFPPVDHMPYLPNLATPKPDVYEKSVMTLIMSAFKCLTYKYRRQVGEDERLDKGNHYFNQINENCKQHR